MVVYKELMLLVDGGRNDMKGMLFQKVQKPYKKAFKKHRDQLFQTLQSKPVIIDDHSYVLVGEGRIQESPLISHFDVCDEYGASANEGIGREVHDFISRILIIDRIRGIHGPLENQAEDDDEEDVPAHLAHFETIAKQVTALLQQETFEAEDMYALDENWHVFWERYQIRVQSLLEAVHDEKLEKGTSIYEEADMIHHLFADLLFTPTITNIPSIDQLIEDNYMYGRLRAEDEPLVHGSTLERRLHIVFVYVYRVVLALAAVIVFGLLLDGESIWEAIAAILIPVVVLRVVNRQMKSRILLKTNSALKEARSTPLSTEEEARTDQEAIVHNRQREPVILYETRGVMVGHLIIIGVFDFVILASTVIFYIQEKDAFILSIGLLITLLLVGMMYIFPRTPISKLKITITEQAIHLRGEKLSKHEVVRILIKENNKSIHIFVNYHDEPYRIRMVAGDETVLPGKLATWASTNEIPFKDEREKHSTIKGDRKK